MKIAVAFAFTLAIAKCSIRQIEVEILPKDAEGIPQQGMDVDTAPKHVQGIAQQKFMPPPDMIDCKTNQDCWRWGEWGERNCCCR